MSESAEKAVALPPQDRPRVPRDASRATIATGDAWEGPTYYGRSQLKAAPFENPVVGSYIFLGGLSGASMLLSTIADLTRSGDASAMVRRGRYMALLAPTIGSALLIYDLRTPQRFYNMLRVAKPTSPMSIGTWILMSFSAAAGVTAAAQAGADYLPGGKFLRALARVTQVPAALAGAGMMTYTAALLSATSTPLWAAAPRGLAVRFGSSSFAAGAAALSMGETPPSVGRALELVQTAALCVESVAAADSRRTYRDKGIEPVLETPKARAGEAGSTGLGVLLPLGLIAASLLTGRRPSPVLRNLTALAVMAGSAAMRVSMMSTGDESALRPDVSFRFAQPDNLPDRA